MIGNKFRSYSVVLLALFILGWGAGAIACAGGHSACDGTSSHQTQDCSTCLCHPLASAAGDDNDCTSDAGEPRSITVDPRLKLSLLAASIFNPPQA